MAYLKDNNLPTRARLLFWLGRYISAWIRLLDCSLCILFFALYTPITAFEFLGWWDKMTIWILLGVWPTDDEVSY